MINVLKAIFWSFIVVALAFAYRACAQDLPDAPQPQAKCQTVTMDEEGKIRYQDVPCKSISSWRALPDPAPKKPTFLTFRKSWQDPPLRTNRQVFDKKFVLLHLGAVAAMIVACRNPRSGEEFSSEIPAVAVVSGADYLMSRFFTEAMSVEAPVYMMQHYSKAAVQ